MHAASLAPSPTGTRFISKKQWLWVIAWVVVAHLVTLGHDWGLGPVKVADPNYYLPIDMRPVELVDEPMGVNAATAVRKPPTPLAKSPVAPADANATPASVAQFEPEPTPLPAPANESAPVPAIAASQAAATADASSSAPALVAESGRSNAPMPGATEGAGTTAGSLPTPSDNAEKVTLTVPKIVKFPDSRNWTFSTTHNSPKVHAPNLATDFRWKLENGQYEVYLGASSLYAAFTKLARHSKGTLGDVGLQPEAFTATQRDGTRTVSYFDNTNRRVTFGAPGRPPRPLLPGAQDELSAAVQLSSMFLGEPDRYPPGERIVMPVVQRTDAQVWVFKVEGEEQLQILRSRVRTIKLTRAPRAEFDTAVTIWLAPEQQYLPVRLRLDYSAERSDDMLWKGF